MITYSVFILFSWLSSLFFLFYAASWVSHDSPLDQRDLDNLRKASESAFFLRG